MQEAFERVDSFKKYTKNYLKVLNAIGHAFPVLQVIHFFVMWHYQVTAIHRNTSGVARFTSLFPPMLIFSSISFKYEDYRKVLGERAWICHSIWFKSLKWVLVIIWAVFMVTRFIPSYYAYYGKMILGGGEYADMVTRKLSPFYYLDVLFVCAVILASDVEDFYRRRLCEDMSERFSLKK